MHCRCNAHPLPHKHTRYIFHIAWKYLYPTSCYYASLRSERQAHIYLDTTIYITLCTFFHHIRSLSGSWSKLQRQGSRGCRSLRSPWCWNLIATLVHRWSAWLPAWTGWTQSDGFRQSDVGSHMELFRCLVHTIWTLLDGKIYIVNSVCFQSSINVEFYFSTTCNQKHVIGLHFFRYKNFCSRNECGEHILINLLIMLANYKIQWASDVPIKWFRSYYFNTAQE